MKRHGIILLSVIWLLFAFKNDKPAYHYFNIDGKKVKFSKVIKEVKDADIILFGEYHNNPISHWMQLELTKELHALKQDKLVLGAEMFESDNQLIMDEYLSGLISEKKFEAEARLWPNYKTDYKPLVSFAKENNLDFIAANVPRRYASLVYGKGFEGLEELSDDAKKLIPALPIKYDPELACYKAMMSASGGMPMHANNNLPKAQAIKDATMAHFILKNWSEGKQVLHYNGAYHSDNFESIVWYLRKANPDLNIKTISTVSQADVDSLMDENKGIADFILCVDENMTSTH